MESPLIAWCARAGGPKAEVGDWRDESDDANVFAFGDGQVLCGRERYFSPGRRGSKLLSDAMSSRRGAVLSGPFIGRILQLSRT
jgi:hypothetical protein